MAEAVLFNIAETILGKLGILAVQEIGLILGVKSELERLKETVSTIKAVLLDAEEKQTSSRQIKEWLGMLKDVVFDANYLLDDFSTEVMRRNIMPQRNKMAKEVHIFFSRSNQLVFSVKMGHNIKAIRERLDDIAANGNKFNFIKQSCETESVLNRERKYTHSYVREQEVIGRDDDREKIIELLFDSSVMEKNVVIIPIVGIGGLGKTTLAQFVYNDERVKNHFNLRLWVCVSDPFDVKQIVKQILESATKEKVEDLEMDTLQAHLRKEIKGKKYLLVLDDVWNESRERWNNLETLLMDGATGSKSLVTTRSDLVAKITGSVSPYHLKGLSEDKSWSLFKNRAFEQGKEPKNTNIVAIGKEIVRKCAGVPLAIRTLGSLLFNKNSEAEWLSFRDTELLKITKDDENGILPILKLSYDHLPSHLKQCFAYCCLFPKDYKLDKQALIRLWIAQGFIQLTNVNQQLEDVGDECFKELLWRSFFQDVGVDWWGDITNCKMHDLMHDLAQSVAGNESNLVDIGATSIGERVRHVSFNSSLLASWDTPAPLLQVRKIQTLLLPVQQGYHDLKVIKSSFDILVPAFRCLRAFDLHNVGFKTIPSCIGKLKHLRYLDLSENKELEELPNSITKLQNLETLSLSYCSKLKKLPRDFRKLVSLRHLEIYGCSQLYDLPCGLGKLTCLQTLSWFCQNNPTLGCGAGLNELKDLNNLRGYFRIYIMDGVQYSNASELAVAANLKAKEYLQTLSYFWWLYKEDEMIAEDAESFFEVLQPHPNVKELEIHYYWGVRFPRWTMGITLRNLVAITFKKCPNCKRIPPMHQLPYLRYLKLESLSAVEYIIDYDNHAEDGPSSSSEWFFPSLKELILWYLPSLKGFQKRIYEDDDSEAEADKNGEEQEESFGSSLDKLTKLNLCDCPKLTSLPPHPNLESLRIFEVGGELVLQRLAPQLSPSSHSKLKHLHLEQIWDLECFPSEVLQNLTSLDSLEFMQCSQLLCLAASEEDFRGLSSLRYLVIKGCTALPSLSRGIQHLTALEDLQIISCQELNLTDGDDSSMHWQGLQSLRRLYLEEIPKLVSLPAGIQHLTTLQHLEIHSCHQFIAVPDWIGNFTSLQRLVIKGCPKLRSLPKGIRCLHSLQELLIAGCPDLTERCQFQTGKDWRKIAHIPSIKIDEETIHGRLID